MPDWNTIVRQRLSPLGLAPEAGESLAEELARHIEDRYRELLSSGIDAGTAYRAALSELDDTGPLRSAPYRRLPKHDPPSPGVPSRGSVGGDLLRDLHFALRSMRKSPIFVVFVVLTLGLGIGANTTVFTLVNTLILNPLPVANPGALVAVSAAQGTVRSGAPAPLSMPDVTDLQARNQSLVSLAAYTSPRIVTIEENGATQRAFCELITSNYFPTLGLTPARGRFFLPEEDTPGGTHPVAILNYGTWQRRFGGADIIGKSLHVNHLALTVVGIAPPGFIGINAMMGPDFWVPAAMAARLLPEELRDAIPDRGKPVFQAVGRLRADATRELAQANLSAVAAALAREYPDTDQGRSVTVRPIRDAILSTGGLASGNAIIFGGAALLIVVGIVLLIACSNVANLLLARSSARQKEIAVRLAIGASRGRLVRQLLTESVLHGLLSGAFGAFTAYAGLHLLFATLPSGGNFTQPRLDASVFVFALVVSLATGFLFGILPALRASRADVAESLKQEARTAGRSRSAVTLANALLVGQVAFSFLLLVTAALFLRSIGRAYQMDPGFQTAHLAVIMTTPGQAGYGPPETKAFYEDVRQRVTRLPGVVSVSWSSNLPLWARAATGLEIENYQRRFQADQVRAILNTVDRDYFETAGVIIRAGRAFTAFDRETSAPVAIVNEKLAHDYWPAGALGRRLRLPGESAARVVVGVARNANYSTWNEAPQSAVYVPLSQKPNPAMTLYIRTRGNPGEVLSAADREIRALGQGIVVDARTGPTIVDNGLFGAKVAVALLSIFGLLALGLASIGLYGILAYSVQRRRREIGVRMALGAGAPTVMRLVLREGMSLVLIGIAIGLAAAVLVGRFLSTMLYGVAATDPVSIAAAAAVLSLVALVACALPARRATRVDPLTALREG